MPILDIINELQILIRSHYGLIFLNSSENSRILEICRQLKQKLNTQLYIWKAGTGLYLSEQQNAIYNTEVFQQALENINNLSLDNIYLILDHEIKDKTCISRIYDIAQKMSERNGIIIFAGPQPEIPQQLIPLSIIMELPEPTREDYQQLLKSVYNEVTNSVEVKIELTSDHVNQLLNNLKGISLEEARRVLTRLMIEDGRLSAEDVREVIATKKHIVEKEGILEYFSVKEKFEDIADLYGLKEWLNKRKKTIQQPEAARAAGLTFPKGILLLGVPGTGKSLSAKAVSLEWGLPLLKLEASRIYNKYIGETEKRFKAALATADKLSPLILWIDEIEKVFASGGDSDSGVSTRVMGSFLSWLQERQGKFSLWQQLTILPVSLLNYCGRDASMRYFLWICQPLKFVRKFSAFI